MSYEIASIGGFILCLGAMTFLIGWVWLAVRACQVRPLWGVLVALFPLFAPPCFAMDHWGEAKLPMLLLYAGVITAMSGARLIGPLH